MILARHDPRQDLPTRRSELYQRYITELFSAWEQRRNPEALPLPKSSYLQGIEAIAWYLHLSYFGRTRQQTETNNTDNLLYSPDRTFIQQRLATALHQQGTANQPSDAERMASQIIDFWLTTGLIEERSWQQWRFLTFRHLTFQEYGVANVLHNAWIKDAQRAWRFLKPRLHHFAWREPLLLLAEQMNTPAIDRLLRHLLCHPSPYDRKRVALAIWWRLTYLRINEIDDEKFKSLSTIVNQFPITTAIDDLFLPPQSNSKRRWFWWFGMLGLATLTAAVAAMAGALGNLL